MSRNRGKTRHPSSRYIVRYRDRGKIAHRITKGEVRVLLTRDGCADIDEVLERLENGSVYPGKDLEIARDSFSIEERLWEISAQFRHTGQAYCWWNPINGAILWSYDAMDEEAFLNGGSPTITARDEIVAKFLSITGVDRVRCCCAVRPESRQERTWKEVYPGPPICH